MKTILILLFSFTLLLFCGEQSSKEKKNNPLSEKENRKSEVVKKKDSKKNMRKVMRLFSPAFKYGKEIPVKYCNTGVDGGKNISIPLEWTEPSERIKSFVLVIVDRHKVANDWIHWVVTNISPTVTELPEGASLSNMPEGAVEYKNSWGKKGYGGPQPPKGTGVHKYECRLYGLTVSDISFSEKPSLKEIENTLKGKASQIIKLIGTFEQK